MSDRLEQLERCQRIIPNWEVQDLNNLYIGATMEWRGRFWVIFRIETERSLDGVTKITLFPMPAAAAKPATSTEMKIKLDTTDIDEAMVKMRAFEDQVNATLQAVNELRQALVGSKS